MLGVAVFKTEKQTLEHLSTIRVEIFPRRKVPGFRLNTPN